MASTPKESCRNTTRRRNVNKKSTMKIEIIRSDEDSDRTVVWTLFVDGVEMYQENQPDYILGLVRGAMWNQTPVTSSRMAEIRKGNYHNDNQ